MIDKITRKKNNFTQISNKLLYDERLSYKARGIFCYLWGKPNDWKVLVKEDLVRNGKETEYSIRQALLELKEFNYIRWERCYEKTSTGKKVIVGIHYFLDDEGQVSLHCDSLNEESLNEESLNEVTRNEYIYINNKDINNTYINNKEKKTNKKEKCSLKKSEIEEFFLRFYKLYKKKQRRIFNITF